MQTAAEVHEATGFRVGTQNIVVAALDELLDKYEREDLKDSPFTVVRPEETKEYGDLEPIPVVLFLSM